MPAKAELFVLTYQGKGSAPTVFRFRQTSALNATYIFLYESLNDSTVNLRFTVKGGSGDPGNLIFFQTLPAKGAYVGLSTGHDRLGVGPTVGSFFVVRISNSAATLARNRLNLAARCNGSANLADACVP